MFSGPDFIPGENSFEIGNFQKINPLEEIKVGQRFVHEFWFLTHKIAPRIGMLLNGLFDPNSSPFPFDFFFFIPCPQVPKNGGGAPNLGAPFPFGRPTLGAPFPFGRPTLGAPFPNNFFAISSANGIPMDARIVPNIPPDCFADGFTTTCPPDCRAANISCFCLFVSRCLLSISF